jgi:hypothetical protein
MGSASVAGSAAATVAEEDAGPAEDAAATLGEETRSGVISEGAGGLNTTYPTPDGPVGFYGDVTIDGTTVTVDDLLVYGAEKDPLDAGPRAINAARLQFIRELAQKGYRTLVINGWRTKNGRIIQKVIDLTKYL